MGHSEDSNDQTAIPYSFTEVGDHAFFEIAFGTGSDAVAARLSVERADDAAQASDDARALVRAQAVHALTAEGCSVREVSDALRIPKSEVGRIRRQWHMVSGQITNAAIALPADTHLRTRDIVLLSWGIDPEGSPDHAVVSGRRIKINKTMRHASSRDEGDER